MKLALACLLLAAAAFGQGTVTIYGTVTDSTGAAVPQATVQAINSGTGAVRDARSDQSGSYVISRLPVGVYTVRIEASGFKTFVQEGIQVQVDENRQVNVALQVGAVTESIEVRAELAQVETRSGAIREIVDSLRIVELPLNGRNPLQLQYLAAGSAGIAARDQAQNESVSINGSRTNSNNYQLDGGDNHDPYFNTPSVFPNPDALEEFSIQTNAYGADRGRNAGAFMAAVTRSGTNNFHGTLFEFVRNEKLNARNFFSNTVPPFKRNQFGGTFGGRIIRDRTFFFGSYQGTTERSAPGAVTATVGTAEQRQGNFSSRSTALRDPQGGTFANSQIPRERLNLAALKFLEAFVPLPNRANGLLSTASQQKNDNHQITGKLDHRFSASNQLSGRLVYNNDAFDEATGNLPGFFASIKYTNWNLAVSDTHIVSPSILNTFTFGYNDIDRRQIPIVPGNRTWNDFGAGFTRTFSVDAPAAMHTQVDGYFNAFSRFPLNHFRTGLQFSELLSWNRGSHFFKLGGDVRRSMLDLQELFRGDPFIRFRNTFTGDALADFLLGLPTQYEQIAEAANKPRVTELDLFLQDDWKLSRRVTLNLGVRWDPWFPFRDELNKFSQIRLWQKSRVFPTAPAGIVFPGDPGTTSSLLRRRLGNTTPRFGFAIDPTGSGRNSIRGGYGIFYSQVRQQANNQIATNQPFSLKLTINNPPGGVLDPYRGIGNPFPFQPPATDAEKASYKWVLPLTVTQWNPDFRDAIAQQWNFNVQRQFFSSWVATAAYVGSKANHLFLTSELNPGVFGAPGANLNARRPLAPTFGPVTDQSSRGNSLYHSMQLTLNKRFASGLTLLTNYTWGKLIDDASTDGDSPANPFNFRNERGPSDLDITHRFVSSFIWQLPSLKAA
ncbi:MAG TPA: carboxypeptidase regulatory-like domain-containing protein, partial [Bryobacteraceae bacterium]|nr:carboxypeptidase regulatory-like domain-containing protein [Bryobacteraceae bacterium]